MTSISFSCERDAVVDAVLRTTDSSQCSPLLSYLWWFYSFSNCNNQCQETLRAGTWAQMQARINVQLFLSRVKADSQVKRTAGIKNLVVSSNQQKYPNEKGKIQ